MMFKSRSHCETSRATSQPFSREGANGRSPSQEDGSGAPEITGVLNPVNPLMFSMQSWKYNLCTFFSPLLQNYKTFMETNQNRIFGFQVPRSHAAHDASCDWCRRDKR